MPFEGIGAYQADCAKFEAGVVDKVKIAVVGLGKMGLSHFAMVNPHPKAETVACDGSRFMTDVLSKNVSVPC